jgi:hypothetical protein
MLIVRSKSGVQIRLTDERWQHIAARHPEMSQLREQVLETLSEPDMIQVGDIGELLAVRHWPATPLPRKFMIVAYREVELTDGFILTAYLTSRPSKARQVLWRR